MDAHPLQAFGILTLVYAVVTAALSSIKLLWLDELITFHIARLSTLSAVWHALAEGADPNPPLTHFAVHACIRLFGFHAYAYRLPAMVGYWIGMLALFFFLKKRLPATWALLGTLLSMSMGGFDWSYESRSYAIFYGFTMLAFYCWSLAAQSFPTPRTRRFALACMVLSLAAAICTNYFAVLAFIPIAGAELTRTALRVRAHRSRSLLHRSSVPAIDWAIWAGLALASTPLLFFHHLIRQNVALYGPYAWNRVSLDSIGAGYADMVEALLYPLGALLAFALLCWNFRRYSDAARARLRPRWLDNMAQVQAVSRTGPPRLSLPECVGVLLLMAYPVLGYVLASVGGGMLASRFVIPVGLGFAIAAALVAYRTFGHLPRAGIVALGLCLLWFMVRESYIGYQFNLEANALFGTFDAFHRTGLDRAHDPIVVSDNLLVLPFQYYAPPEIASRVVDAVDFAAIMRDRHEASSQVNLWHGRTFYGFPIVPLAQFQYGTGEYTIVTSNPNWLLDDLRDHGYRVDWVPGSETLADPLNYPFIPLAHGKSVIYRTRGDQARLDPTFYAIPYPLPLAGELPVEAR